MRIAIWQLYKLGERIVFEDEREFFVVGRPIRHRWRDIEKHFESDLESEYLKHQTGLPLR